MDIGLIVYGEDGEVEYGGTTKYKYTPCYDTDHMKKVFLNDTYDDVINKSRLSDKDRYWFEFPKKYKADIKITHFSYFENWNPYNNYMLAKEKYGLEDLVASNTGTFTNFAHNDQALTSLHYYLMYLKFGFGRATQDAGIEIRRDAMTREQAINLVNLYDGIFPEEHLKTFTDHLKSISFLSQVRLNIALKHETKSFLKLKIKVRDKIVADGLNDETFDVTKKGIHVNAEEFNKLVQEKDTIILDMRNHYESEIGHFKNAICPDVDTFRDSLEIIEDKLKEHKEDKNLLMYCTGGIRCEKASAYFKHKGFKNGSTCKTYVAGVKKTY